MTRSSTMTPMYASSRSRRTAGSRTHVARGVEARNQSLRGRLLVARRAVDLPGEEQAGRRVGLERRRSSVGWTKSYSTA